MADETSSTFVINALVQELLVAADEINSQVALNGAVVEGLGVSEDVTAQAAFNARVDENLLALDAPRAAASFITSIQEGIGAADRFIGRLLWDTIDTSETSDWVPVESVALTLRITVGGGFSSGAFASGPISGLGGDTVIITAPENWDAVNTEQPTTWTTVKTQT
jgi:hypothetical protein